ncbi:hypothetical protein [Celeribacter sp.]|uniref:hypothetical protein n=1 Tax=Celeribacter sp. TaxID=1890673 RepID=UPI003A8E7780
MSEVEEDPLIRKVIKRQFVWWAYPKLEHSALRLGQKFDEDVKALIGSLDEARNVFIHLLNDFSVSEVELAAGLNGADLSIEREEQLSQAKKAAMAKLHFYDREMLIAIGAFPDELPDYHYWGMRDQVSVSEFVWLSIGLEPDEQLERYFSQSEPRSRNKNAIVKKEAQRRIKLVNSASNLRSLPMTTIRTDIAKEWLDQVPLDVPKGFAEALRQSWERLRSENQKFDSAEPQKADDIRKPDPREMRTMAKLVTAIAIDAYGYDPSANRSPIPKEIEGITDELGLGVSSETVLKYLRMGANLIDKN